jgi:hypothetical protein
MMHIFLFIIFLSLWLGCGIISWGFQDGYFIWIDSKSYRITSESFIIIFNLLLGPVCLMVTFFMFGFKHWTHAFWSKNRKNGLKMLEKLESCIE